MFRRVLVVLAAALLGAMTLAAPANAAVRPFGPQVTVVGGCAADLSDALVTSAGQTRGFAACSGGAVIRFFSRNADGTVNPSEATGFTGQVLGVAYDATATYALYWDEGQGTIRIGKRTNAGAYSSRAVGTVGGVGVPTGDVIASGGQWLGVWSTQTGPGGEFAQTELFQAGSTTATRRITSTAANVDDYQPSLAYSGGIPVLVWVRQTNPEQPGPADLRVAKLVSGAWQSRLFASAGSFNLQPDLATAGGLTFVAWYRDGRIVVAGNLGGAFTSHTFATAGFEPKVTGSTEAGAVRDVMVTWTADAGGTFFAETVGTDGSVQRTWSGATIAGGSPFGIGAFARKATVVYRGVATSAVYARSQS